MEEKAAVVVKFVSDEFAENTFIVAAPGGSNGWLPAGGSYTAYGDISNPMPRSPLL